MPVSNLFIFEFFLLYKDPRLLGAKSLMPPVSYSGLEPPQALAKPLSPDPATSPGGAREGLPLMLPFGGRGVGWGHAGGILKRIYVSPDASACTCVPSEPTG